MSCLVSLYQGYNFKVVLTFGNSEIELSILKPNKPLVKDRNKLRGLERWVVAQRLKDNIFVS